MFRQSAFRTKSRLEKICSCRMAIKFEIRESSFNMTKGGGFFKSPPFGCLKFYGAPPQYLHPPFVILNELSLRPKKSGTIKHSVDRRHVYANLWPSALEPNFDVIVFENLRFRASTRHVWTGGANGRKKISIFENIRIRMDVA